MLRSAAHNESLNLSALHSLPAGRGAHGCTTPIETHSAVLVLLCVRPGCALEPARGKPAHCAVHCAMPGAARTLAAFCRRSPDSPVQMFRVSFATRTSRMGLAVLSDFFSAIASRIAATTQQRPVLRTPFTKRGQSLALQGPYRERRGAPSTALGRGRQGWTVRGPQWSEFFGVGLD